MAVPQDLVPSGEIVDTPTLAPSVSEVLVLESLASKSAIFNDGAPVLYRSRLPSSTAHLPQDLQVLIENFRVRNPFCPPEKLINSVVEVPDHILALTDPGPHVFPGCNSVGSSVHNIHLANQVQANAELNSTTTSSASSIATAPVIPASASEADQAALAPSPLPQQPPGSVVHKCYRVLSLGESSLFLNLFPFAGGHAVVTNSEAYYVSMRDFTLRQLRDSLCLCIEYIKACARAAWRGQPYDVSMSEPEEHTLTVGDALAVRSSTAAHSTPRALVWPVILWNYLPPSAGSVIHPHWQCFVEPAPSPMLSTLIDRSHDWAARTHSSEELADAANALDEGRAVEYGYASALLRREAALCSTAASAASMSQGKPASTSMLRSRFIGCVPVPAASGSVNGNASGDTLPQGLDLAQAGLSSVQGARVLPPGQYVFALAPFSPRTVNEVHLMMASITRPLVVDRFGRMIRQEDLPDAPVAAAASVPVGPVSDISGLSPAQQHALAAAILSVVRGYDRIGVASFNMTMFSGPAAGFQDAWADAGAAPECVPEGVELPLFRALSPRISRSDASGAAKSFSCASDEGEPKWYSGGTLPPRVMRNFATTRTREHCVRMLHEGAQATRADGEYPDEFEFVPSATLGVTFTACVKFMSRPAPVSCYTNDSGPTERHMDTFVINSAPEDYSECLRNVWDEIVAGIM